MWRELYFSRFKTKHRTRNADFGFCKTLNQLVREENGKAHIYVAVSFNSVTTGFALVPPFSATSLSPKGTRSSFSNAGTLFCKSLAGPQQKLKTLQP